jgi:hypothetical protein
MIHMMPGGEELEKPNTTERIPGVRPETLSHALIVWHMAKLQPCPISSRVMRFDSPEEYDRLFRYEYGSI